ncbi:m163 protein [Murid betaherpesvirus 1]|nr:m163 protein [Murid betaherpesvirus 1]
MSTRPRGAQFNRIEELRLSVGAFPRRLRGDAVYYHRHDRRVHLPGIGRQAVAVPDVRNPVFYWWCADEWGRVAQPSAMEARNEHFVARRTFILILTLLLVDSAASSASGTPSYPTEGAGDGPTISEQPDVQEALQSHAVSSSGPDVAYLTEMIDILGREEETQQVAPEPGAVEVDAEGHLKNDSHQHHPPDAPTSFLINDDLNTSIGKGPFVAAVTFLLIGLIGAAVLAVVYLRRPNGSRSGGDKERLGPVPYNRV